MELKLNLIVDNLNKFKRQLENINIGSKSKETKSGGGVGGFAFAGGLLGGIFSQLKSVNKILEIISALINRLVAPFVPILLTLMKPVFMLLRLVSNKLLEMFTGGSLYDKIAESIKVSLSAGLGPLTGLIFDETYESIKEYGGKISESLSNVNTKIIDSMSKINFSKIFKSLYNKLESWWNSIDLTDTFIKLYDKLVAQWDNLVIIFDDAWYQLKVAVVKFINLLINMVNDISSYVNKYLGFFGVKIGTISNIATPQKSSNNVTININNPTNQSVDPIIDKLRAELSRRGIF